MGLNGSRIHVTDFSQPFLAANLPRNIIQVEQLLYLQADCIIEELVQIQQDQYWIWATGPF